MTQIQEAVIKELANNDMNVAKTARALYFHRNTVDYHVRQIRLETGLNPLNFYDLLKLLEETEND